MSGNLSVLYVKIQLIVVRVFDLWGHYVITISIVFHYSTSHSRPTH